MTYRQVVITHKGRLDAREVRRSTYPLDSAMPCILLFPSMSEEQTNAVSSQSVEVPIQGRRRLQNNPEGLKDAARRLIAGERPKDVLLAAGYAPGQAKRGKLPKMLLRAIASQSKQFEGIGKTLDPERVANTVKGRLFYNTITGESKGIDAAKALGSMKEYQLFQPDSLTGVIVLQQPSLALAGKPIQTIDAKDLNGDD
jgi:hypothetical protein